MPRLVLLAVLLLAAASSAAALWILPGVAPRNYFAQDPTTGNQAYIDLKVNKMTSPRTQLPYAYYSLPFCKPQRIEDVRENLGEMLAGDKLENSQYIVRRHAPRTTTLLTRRYSFRLSRTFLAACSAARTTALASSASSRSASMRSTAFTGAWPRFHDFLARLFGVY